MTEDISQLKAEVADLQELLRQEYARSSDLLVDLGRMIEARAKLEDDLEDLREALLSYGWHTDACACHRDADGPDPSAWLPPQTRCTCGFAALVSSG